MFVTITALVVPGVLWSIATPPMTLVPAASGACTVATVIVSRAASAVAPSSTVPIELAPAGSASTTPTFRPPPALRAAGRRAVRRASSRLVRLMREKVPESAPAAASSVAPILTAAGDLYGVPEPSPLPVASDLVVPPASLTSRLMTAPGQDVIRVTRFRFVGGPGDPRRTNIRRKRNRRGVYASQAVKTGHLLQGSRH